MSDTKKKLIAMINQQRHQVDIKAIAQWLRDKI